MARSLGLDIGNRRIGVAVCDALKVIARPLDVIDRKHRDAIGAIITHVQTQEVDEIVVGYPMNVNGTAGEQAHAVERFVASLEVRIKIPIVFCDERFSTGEAREIMGAKRRRDSSQPDDAFAAAVILQRHLDKRRDEHEAPCDDELYTAEE